MARTTTTRSPRRSLALLAFSLAVTIFAALPAASSASQVMFENGGARYKASGGEDNVVTAKMTSNTTVKFQDTGAVIWNAGPGCTIIDDHNAECTRPGGLRVVHIGTGSFDDKVTAELDTYKVSLTIESGSDDDTVNVTGTQYIAKIDTGSWSSDTITEGDGRSTILADGANTGNGGDDIVKAGAQRDVIYGGKGNDELTGGPGADEIRGQQGNDTINALDGTADAVLGCGPDMDTITADPQDTPGADCETVL